MSRNNIKAICQLKKAGEFWNLFVIALSIVIGITLEFIFRANGVDEADFGEVLTGSIAFGYVIINMFLKVFVQADEVPRGLCFGMTRKVLFGYSRVVDFLEIAVFTIIAIIASTSIATTTVFKIAIIIFGLIMWIEATAGNGMLRYGKVVYWIYYICFLLIMIGGPRLIGEATGMSDATAHIVDMIINPFYNQLPVWVGIIAFAVAGLVVNWITFRKIPVNLSI
jgi:hypothetical protein